MELKLQSRAVSVPKHHEIKVYKGLKVTLHALHARATVVLQKAGALGTDWIGGWMAKELVWTQ